MKKIACIYSITSPSGKVYIGQTRDFKKRMVKHKMSIGKVSNKLYSSCLKHGWQNMKVEILHSFEWSIYQMLL